MRRANSDPDAWLFVEGVVDWTWDTPTLHGKPVYHCEWMALPNDGRGDPCPWVLLFFAENPHSGHINYQFFRGYDDYQTPTQP